MISQKHENHEKSSCVMVVDVEPSISAHKHPDIITCCAHILFFSLILLRIPSEHSDIVQPLAIAGACEKWLATDLLFD